MTTATLTKKAPLKSVTLDLPIATPELKATAKRIRQKSFKARMAALVKRDGITVGHAMRVGARRTTFMTDWGRLHGVLNLEERLIGSACALGAANLGLKLMRGETPEAGASLFGTMDLEVVNPALTEYTEIHCVACQGLQGRLSDMVMHQNDVHRRGRLAVAQYLDFLGV